jgi:hypothetical protein
MHEQMRSMDLSGVGEDDDSSSDSTASDSESDEEGDAIDAEATTNRGAERKAAAAADAAAPMKGTEELDGFCDQMESLRTTAAAIVHAEGR